MDTLDQIAQATRDGVLAAITAGRVGLSINPEQITDPPPHNGGEATEFHISAIDESYIVRITRV